MNQYDRFNRKMDLFNQFADKRASDLQPGDEIKSSTLASEWTEFALQHNVKKPHMEATTILSRFAARIPDKPGQRIERGRQLKGGRTLCIVKD